MGREPNLMRWHKINSKRFENYCSAFVCVCVGRFKAVHLNITFVRHDGVTFTLTCVYLI